MSLCSHLLRVPLLFTIDKIFKISFGIQDLPDLIITLNNTFVNSSLSQTEIGNHAQYYKPIFLLFIKIIVTCLIFCLSLCLLVLPPRHLYIVYLHVASVCVVLISYWANIQALNVLSDKYINFKIDTINEVISLDLDVIIHICTQLQVMNFLYLLFCSIILQFCLSQIFNFLQFCTTNHPIHKAVILSFIIPTYMALIPSMHGIFNSVTLLSTLLQLFIILKILWLNSYRIINLLCDGFNHTRNAINHYGIMDFVYIELCRLKFGRVLRIFWAIRVLDQITFMLRYKDIKNETLIGVVKYLLVKGCDTFTAVLGMSSFVLYFCNYIGVFFQWVLLTENVEEMAIGESIAMVFIANALKTRLTVVEPEKRFILLYLIIYSVGYCLLNSIYCLVKPLLMSLSVSGNRSLNRHLRALFVAGFLLVFSINMFTNIWSYNVFGNARLSLTFINIKILFKVLVTLVIYSLHMINGYHNTIWEKLDNYVFYIKSFKHVLCFCLSTSNVLNCITNMVFDFGGIANAPIVCIQAYIVIWSGIRDGWRVFIRHRTVMKKIELLADATSVQLSGFEDICPICRQNMVSAKVTKCNHYFHSICLRKWLHFKDSCPMCNNILYQA